MARDIGKQFYDKKEMREAILFLSKYGISNTYAVKIFNTYGPGKYQDIIKTNPYQIAADVSGIGFKTADEIAEKVGILKNSDYRIQAGILYVLSRASMDGHVFLPKASLIKKTSDILGVEQSNIEYNLMSLAILKKVIVQLKDQEEQVYITSYYYME